MSWQNNGKVRPKRKRDYLYELEDEGGSVEAAKEAFLKRGGKVEKVDITKPEAEKTNEVGDSSQRYSNLGK